ncbi:nadX [Mytilus coruscus]|uniref:NadX n=1 Tax=Mytilus coruscus TaxID=42192 RepID=A0A6J8CH54_MYTCO|nr:nadX [Mytilus coruscus]
MFTRNWLKLQLYIVQKCTIHKHGKYLVQTIQDDDRLELAFIWNRAREALEDFGNKELILEELNDFPQRQADLIVEVAHPKITHEWGPKFLQNADYMALKVTMTKHPSSFKLEGDLKKKIEEVSEEPLVLYDGPVRNLCPLAPNNVNTMAAAALAAHNLGFDKVQGSIIADPKLENWHIVEVETWGPGSIENKTAFHVKTVRKNPANVGAVTGSATYASFFSSILGAHGKGPGLHLC